MPAHGNDTTHGQLNWTVWCSLDSEGHPPGWTVLISSIATLMVIADLLNWAVAVIITSDTKLRAHQPNIGKITPWTQELLSAI